MLTSWEYYGGFLAGFGMAAILSVTCSQNGIAPPTWIAFAGAMVMIFGMGIAKGGENLRRKDKACNNPAKKL